MRSFKKIAAVIMAVAMLCSFTVLANAAGIKVELSAITAPNTENPTVTLGYTNDTNAAQRTMLVYKGDRNLAGADIIYIDQFADNADPVELTLGTDEEDYGTYTVVAGGMDVAEADVKTFVYGESSASVTLTKTAGGNVLHDYDGTFSAEPTEVTKGTGINFEFIPTLGYTVAVTINGENANIPTTGGKYFVTVNGETAIDVVFTEAVESADTQSITSAGIYDIPADSSAADEADTLASKIVFGKAIASTDGEILEAGMYLEKKDTTDGIYKPFIASKRGIGGPYFKANARTADDRYGIRFLRFEAGEYRVRSYAKYGEGEDDVAYGEWINFEVR